MSVIRLTQTGSDGQYFDSDYDEPCDSSDSEGEHWEYGHRANPWYQTTTDSEYYPPFGTDANQQALSHQSSHFYQGLVQVPPPVPLHQPPTPPYTMMMPPVTQPTQPGSWRPEEHLKYQPPNEMSFSNFGAMEKPIQVDPAPPMLPMMESHMVYQNQNQVNYSNFPPVPPPMYMQLPQQGNGFMGIPASTSIMRNSAAFPGVTTPVCQYGAVKPQGLNESPLCTNRELYPALPYGQ